MKIYVNVKAIGKKKAVFDHLVYEIKEVRTIQELISEIAQIEALQYNSQAGKCEIIKYLSGDEIEAQAKSGKVGFGNVYSDQKADINQAVMNACQAYEDGLVRIFQNEEELGDIHDEIHIQEGDLFTFMRLTFLAGRLW